MKYIKGAEISDGLLLKIFKPTTANYKIEAQSAFKPFKSDPEEEEKIPNNEHQSRKCTPQFESMAQEQNFNEPD